MALIIILIVVGVIIYFARKSSSGAQSQSIRTESTTQQMRFEELTEEKLSTRQEQFDDLIRGPNRAQLTKCFETIEKMFTPTKNGNFAGCFSGYLTHVDRAGKMAKTDNEVITLLDSHAEAYQVWYDTLYDHILNSVYTSQDGKMANAAERVISDVMQGDDILESCSAWEMLEDPGNIGKTIKIQTDSTTIKLEIYEKNGRIVHEVKNAYQFFKDGLSLDPLIRKAQILIHIGSMYNDPTFKFKQSSIAKYSLPSLNKLQQKE